MEMVRFPQRWRIHHSITNKHELQDAREPRFLPSIKDIAQQMVIYCFPDSPGILLHIRNANYEKDIQKKVQFRDHFYRDTVISKLQHDQL